jgi:hypothetical protein
MPSVLANRVQVPESDIDKRKRKRKPSYKKVLSKSTRGADRRVYHGYVVMKDVVLLVDDLQKTGVKNAHHQAHTLFLCSLVIVIVIRSDCEWVSE